MADSEERTLKIVFVAESEQLQAELDKIEQRAAKGVSVRTSAAPGGAGQARLSERYDTAYENRLASDRTRAAREQERSDREAARAQERAAEAARRNAERVERAWDAAAFAQQRQIERQAQVAERQASQSAGGGVGGGGTGGGFFTRGLGRIAGAGFLLREGLNVQQSYAEFQERMALADNQRQQLEATLAYRQRLTSIPIAGQLVGFLSDPGGQGQADIQRTLQQAEAGEQTARLRAANEPARIALRDRAAEAAALPGFERQRARIDAEFNAQTRAARERINEENAPSLVEWNRRRTEARSRYNEVVAQNPWNPNDPNTVAARAAFNRQSGELAAEERDRNANAGRRLNTETAQARTIRDSELRDLSARVLADAAGLQLGAAASGLRARQMPYEAAQAELRGRNAISEAAELDPERRGLLAARGRAEEAAQAVEISRERRVTSFGYTARIAAAHAEALHDPITAQIDRMQASAQSAVENAPAEDKLRAAAEWTAKFAAFNSDVNRSIERVARSASTRLDVARAELGGNRLGARLAALSGEEAAALADLPNNPRFAGARARLSESFAAENALARKRDADERAVVLQGLQGDVNVTGLLAQGREKSAQASAVRERAELESSRFAAEGGPDALARRRLALQAGENRERAFLRSLELEAQGSPISNRGIAAGGIPSGYGAAVGPQRNEDLSSGIAAVKASIDKLHHALIGVE